MQTNNSINTINDLTKETLLQYIADLPREERNKLKKYLADNPEKTKTPQGAWSTTRGYIWNTYFAKKPVKNKNITFEEQLEQLLNL